MLFSRWLGRTREHAGIPERFLDYPRLIRVLPDLFQGFWDSPQFSMVSGSLRTELGTGNRTDLEPELAEPDMEPEPAEPELEKMKIVDNPQKSKKVQKSSQIQIIPAKKP